jgi:hypothetical protein
VHVLHALSQRLDGLQAFALLRRRSDRHRARNLTVAPRPGEPARRGCARAAAPA